MNKIKTKRLIYLAVNLFKQNPDGQEFLDLLKQMHLETPTFPIDTHKIKRHGGPLGWAAYREGNLDMLRKIELMSESQKLLTEENA